MVTMFLLTAAVISKLSFKINKIDIFIACFTIETPDLQEMAGEDVFNIVKENNPETKVAIYLFE